MFGTSQHFGSLDFDKVCIKRFDKLIAVKTKTLMEIDLLYRNIPCAEAEVVMQ